jgi:hypothetical protein
MTDEVRVRGTVTKTGPLTDMGCFMELWGTYATFRPPAGHGACGTCHVEVLAGPELPELLRRRLRLRRHDLCRLSCQIRPTTHDCRLCGRDADDGGFHPTIGYLFLNRPYFAACERG